MNSKPRLSNEEIIRRVEKEKLEMGKLKDKKEFETVVKKVGKAKK